MLTGVAEELAVEGNAMNERGSKGTKGGPHAERYNTAALVLWRLGFVAQRVAKRMLDNTPTGDGQ